MKEVPPTLIETMVKPLEMLIQAKLYKGYTSALSLYQVMAAANLLCFEHKITFLDNSLKLLDSSDDMIPIKVIQILHIMLTHSDVTKAPLSSMVLTLCLKAFESRSQIIKNSVFAVLSQLYSLLFEEYANLCKGKKIEAQLAKVQEVCAEQIERLIELTGEKHKNLVFQSLGMDILTIILASSHGNIVGSQVLMDLLGKSYCSHLINTIQLEANNYPLLVRAVKSATQLMLTLQTSYNLLQPILQISSSIQPWHRYLALECFSSLFGEYKQIQLMHGMVNNVTNMRVY